MTSNVYVAGVGMIPFVKPGATAPYPVMGAEATKLALADASGVGYDIVYSRPMSATSTAIQPAVSARCTRSA